MEPEILSWLARLPETRRRRRLFPASCNWHGTAMNINPTYLEPLTITRHILSMQFKEAEREH